jgi:geranylgeranyl reductase
LDNPEQDDMSDLEHFDVIVVGGGPSGATAADDLAKAGHSVMLLDRAGRIKPCGGAIPPRLVRDFDIPADIIVARINSARMISPKGREVDMPIDGGYVGMVDREVFDEWLRDRAAASGAVRRTGTFEEFSRDANGRALIAYRSKDAQGKEQVHQVTARLVIGADGANSAVAKQALPGAKRVPFVFAYHEIVRSPSAGQGNYDGKRCDVFYQGGLSPDFYAWIFPHGETASIGTGSMHKGFSLRGSVARLREQTGLAGVETIRREGAPIPLKPLKRWDNGRKRFMKAHGTVFWVLSIMQHFWYRNDKRRERFVNICRDEDVQRLTWQAYMHKELVRANPVAHARIFFKDMAHLLGLVST